MCGFTLQFGLLNARSQAGPLSQSFLLHCSTGCQNSGLVLCATHQPLVSQHLHGFPLQASVWPLLMPAPSHLVPAASNLLHVLPCSVPSISAHQLQFNSYQIKCLAQSPQ